MRENHLLRLLDDATLQALTTTAEQVTLKVHERLATAQEPMRHAWFPTAGVLSMLAPVDAHQQVEIATVGCEGFVGVPAVLGAPVSAATVEVQIAGDAWRVPAAALRQLALDHPLLGQVLQRYIHALIVQMGQGTACNRMHKAEQRCARWLLQTHDRVEGDEFELTQEFLAQMLGERRATVNHAALALQQRGWIRYSRGRIAVVDRAGLEGASCACYRIVRDEYARALDTEPGSP
jgi:CRP-like cAMP-binding protein